jgi:hypothetical protein
MQGCGFRFSGFEELRSGTMKSDPVNFPTRSA